MRDAELHNSTPSPTSGADVPPGATSDHHTDGPDSALPPSGLRWLALGLGVALCIGVMAGAWVMMQRPLSEPVAMGPVDAPAANAPECADFLAALPEKLSTSEGTLHRAPLLDPAPEGAAAYRRTDLSEVNIRCGIHLPDQFSVLSAVSPAGWTSVADATPGSTLQTDYYVGGSPAIAVTSEDPALTSATATAVSEKVLPEAPAVFRDPAATPAPSEFPLASIAMAPGTDSGEVAARCASFARALPDTLGAYTRLSPEEVAERIRSNHRMNVDIPSHTTVYTKEGAEPVVIRCGADLPAEYEPGLQLTDINGVNWFDRSSLAQGSTAGQWFGLGMASVVAISLPTDAASVVLPEVSLVMEDALGRAR